MSSHTIISTTAAIIAHSGQSATVVIGSGSATLVQTTYEPIIGPNTSPYTVTAYFVVEADLTTTQIVGYTLVDNTLVGLAIPINRPEWANAITCASLDVGCD